MSTDELVALARGAYLTAKAAGAPDTQARMIAAIEAGQVGDNEPLTAHGLVNGEPQGLTPDEYEATWAEIIARATG